MKPVDFEFSEIRLDEYLGQLKGVCLIHSVDEISGADISGEVLVKSLSEKPYIAEFFRSFQNEIEAYRFRKELISAHHSYWLFKSNYAYLHNDETPIQLLGPDFQKLPEEFEYLMH